MLSGRLPFEAETPMTMLFLHAYESPAPLGSIAPEVPQPLVDVVARMMAKEPADRYGSCQEALAGLRAFGRRGRAAPDEKPVADGPNTLVPFAVGEPVPSEDEAFLAEAAGSVRVTLWARLRHWILRRLSRHAPDFARRWQNTIEQVDAAVSEYARRRSRLAKLCAEAQHVRDELSALIRVNLEAAARAREGADLASAEKLEQAEEHLAALRRQRSSQQRHVEDLQLKLSRADATLARLRSQRDVLEQRWRAAEAQNLEAGGRPWRSRRPWAAPLVLASVLVLAVPLLWPSSDAGPRSDGVDDRGDSSAVELREEPGSEPPTAADVDEAQAPPPVSKYLQQTFEGHSDYVESVAYSPDGSLLASGSRDKTVILWDPATGELLQTLEGHADPIFAVAFSPDGKLLAAMSESQKGSNPRNRPRTMTLWNVEAGELLHVLKPPPGPTVRKRTVRRSWRAEPGEYDADALTLAFSPDGALLASSDEHCSVRLWDVSTGKLQRNIGEPPTSDRIISRSQAGRVTSIEFSPDGATLAIAGRGSLLYSWDVGTGEFLGCSYIHGNAIGSAFFSPEGDVLASADGDGAVALWDRETLRIWRTLRRHAGRVRSIAFAPDQTLLASASDDHTVILWDIATGRFQTALDGHTGPVRSVAFSPDGSTLASAGGDHRVRLWSRPQSSTGRPELSVVTPPVPPPAARPKDLCAGELIRFAGHADKVLDLRFLPDGSGLISSGADRTVRLWDLAGRRELRRYTGYAGPVYGVDVSPDGKHFIAGDGTGNLVLRDIETGAETRRYEAHAGPVRCVRFGTTGRRFVSGGEDGCVRLWDVEAGAEIRCFLCKAPISAVAIHAEGISVLAAVSTEKVLHKWLATQERNKADHTFRGHTETVRGCIYFPTTPWHHAISSCGEDAPDGSDFVIRMWETYFMQEEFRRFVGHTGRPWGLALSPDLTLLASGAADKTVRLWDVESAQEVHRFTGHEGPVRPVAFSPDGRLVASGSADTTVRVWQVPGAEALLAGSAASDRLRAPADAVALLTFEKDTIVHRADKILVQDASAAANHFEGAGKTVTADGRAGACLDLKGRMLRLPRPLLHEKSEYTLSAWVNCRDAASTFRIYGESSDATADVDRAALLEIALSSQSSLVVRARNALSKPPSIEATTPAGSLPPARWHFVAIRLESGSPGRGTLTVWINDRQFPLTLQATHGGRGAGVCLGPGDGMIDEMAIYHRALSDAEIQILFEMGANGLSLSNP
jgi:WD40 repeat protein